MASGSAGTLSRALAWFVNLWGYPWIVNCRVIPTKTGSRKRPGWLSPLLPSTRLSRRSRILHCFNMNRLLASNPAGRFSTHMRM